MDNLITNIISYLSLLLAITLLIAMAIHTPLSSLIAAAIGGGFWLIGRWL